MRNKSFRICSTTVFSTSQVAVFIKQFFQIKTSDLKMEGGGMHGLGEVQHILLRPLLPGTHTQNITEEKAQLPSSPGYDTDYFEYFIYFLIYNVKKG
jgi:hypothetical protein